MKLRPNRLPLIGLAVALALLLARGSGQAAVSQPQGISVSPAYQQVSIPLGAASQPIKLIVTNHESKPETIDISSRDFNTLGETGGLFFVGSNPTQLEKKYGLAKWISLAQNQLTILPGQAATINASILNLPDLAPGGHYGAIMLSLNNNANAGGKINIHPIASSLLFVTRLGGDTHRLSLAGVTAKHSIISRPAKVTLRFYNAGNTHVVPRGIVSILGPNGKLVSKGIINQQSDIILPQTYRLMDVSMQKVIASNSLGKYKIRVDFRFDGINKYRQFQTSLWFVPWYLIALLVAFMLGALTFKGYTNLRSWHK